jgi:hypothetical protein
MDDEFDDKGWDGDMGDGEVSKIKGILFYVSCFILSVTVMAFSFLVYFYLCLLTFKYRFSVDYNGVPFQ